MLARLVSKKWLLPTLLIPLAMGVMIRLGFWQLDRLEGRREHNRHVRAMRAEEPLHLNKMIPAGSTSKLAGMEYRDVVVRGQYLHQWEMVIRNQAWDHQPGVHLLTPMAIEGTDRMILVDRGWIPLEAYQDGSWKTYTSSSQITVKGMIRTSQSAPALGGRANPTPPAEGFADAWQFVDIDAIEQQLDLPLLPVYVQQIPREEDDQLPYTAQPAFELSQGPHLGYAIQWFMFAAILGVGYPVYVYRQEKSKGRDER